MTAQRLVRGSKARIIASLCAVVFCVGLLVLFQKSQAQLDDVNKNYEICVQQQESLSTQLQVIVDYKTRLEKSLQAEKSEHKQTRTELESRINDEKSRRDKTSMEANIRFQSLQQHYKLLQTKHDDFKEKFDKAQQQYSEDTEKLQSSIKELQEQLKQSKVDKEKSLENLKSLYLQEKVTNEHLVEEQKNIKADNGKWESEINHLTKLNHQLGRELEKYKHKGESNFETLKHEDVIPAPQRRTDHDNTIATIIRKFAKQIEVEDDVYEMRDKNNKPLDLHDSNVSQINTPNKGDNSEHHNDQVVLQKPSSSARSSTKSSLVSQGNLGNARPLLLPTMTPASKNNGPKLEKLTDNVNNNVLPMPNIIMHKKIPPGVVPVPMQELQKNDEAQSPQKSDDKNGIPEDINLALPNRYRSNIIEAELQNEINKETKPDPKLLNIQNEPEINMGADMNQQDNAAMEVIDHVKNPVQEDPLHLMDVNPDGIDVNDAKLKELEHALNEPVANLLDNKKMKKQPIDAMRNMERGDTGALRAPPGGAMYENEGDYVQKEDLQIEEADPEGEEDDDGDDYDGHIAARQKEPAVRN